MERKINQINFFKENKEVWEKPNTIDDDLQELNISEVQIRQAFGESLAKIPSEYTEKHQLWGGSFTESISKVLEDLNSSIEIDKRLYKEDIDGSIAYAEALSKIGIISTDENKLIQNSLEFIQNEWKQGDFKISEGDEDIHTANERRLKVSRNIYIYVKQ